MNIPKNVRICECWARDGIQGHPQIIPTEKKIEIINRLIDVGFKRIEVTSFSHPKLVPQFADCLDVLKGINRKNGDVAFIAIVPNEKALDRLLEASDKGYGVHEITAIISASEDHLLANLEMTFAEVMPGLANIVKRARKNGLNVIGCIGTSFGCPLAGDVPIEKLIELTDWYLQQGATSIMLGDTTGEANPRQVRTVYRRMRELFPTVDFIGHFHDTRGMGLANTFAALEEGVVFHDCSIGGMGGQPATRRPKYHKGYTGNACTEDMLGMMTEMGIDTGLDINRVLELAWDIEKICGGNLRGQVTRSRPVRHRSKNVLTLEGLHVGREIPAALVSAGNRISAERMDQDAIKEWIVRDALEKNWPLPERMKINTGALETKGDMDRKTILVTTLSVLKKEGAKACLKVLSQKSNGDVYLDGTAELEF